MKGLEMKSHGTKIALTFFLAAVASFGGVALGAGDKDSEPSIRHHEECEPVRSASALRQRVVWSARDGALVALGAQLVDDRDAPASSAPWRLVVTTLDRTLVEERRGVSPLRDGAGFATVAPRLWRQAGIGPADVDVVQVYENFTGGVVMALIEHGFCAFDDAGEVLVFENLIAPHGGLPLNTSGGNLAECYMHGLGLQLEAVRQLRGSSCNQVPGARVALAASGPMVPVTSTCVYGTQETLA